MIPNWRGGRIVPPFSPVVGDDEVTQLAGDARQEEYRQSRESHDRGEEPHRAAPECQTQQGAPAQPSVEPDHPISETASHDDGPTAGESPEGAFEGGRGGIGAEGVRPVRGEVAEAGHAEDEERPDVRREHDGGNGDREGVIVPDGGEDPERDPETAEGQWGDDISDDERGDAEHGTACGSMIKRVWTQTGEWVGKRL